MHCAHHHHCLEDAIEQAEVLCHEQGLQFTELRRKVLQLIWANHGPAKAYDLLGKLKSKGAAKPPTVYRTLDFLQEHGLVHKLNRLNAYVGCSHPEQHHQCYFLICSECDEVQECCNPSLTEAISKTAQKNKFKANSSSIEIEGLCQECHH